VASGFDAGADDYLVKPFTPQDLLTRVEALTTGLP
jgi:two-component system phosphate regulon response regulator PhoB